MNHFLLSLAQRRVDQSHFPHVRSFMTHVLKHFVKLSTGEQDLRTVEGTEQIIPIDKIIVHPKYDPQVGPRYDYDVALIKLKYPSNFTSNVRLVLLPTMDFPPGTNCYVTGWGNTKEKGNISQVNILMF